MPVGLEIPQPQPAAIGTLGVGQSVWRCPRGGAVGGMGGAGGVSPVSYSHNAQ